MTCFSHCKIFLSVAGFCVTILSLPVAEHARGQEVNRPDGTGIVWFVGSVRKSESDGQPTIDMGDAQSLVEGDEVTIFRAEDMILRPLGTFRIEESFATWSIPAKRLDAELKDGDRVIYVRTLTQLGTGESFREAFLRQQLIKTGTRNSYSTVLQQHQAETLENYIAKQPRWARDQLHIAGTIRSASVKRKTVDELQPLLNQVMQFQKYQTLGVEIEKAVGPDWQSALTTLTPVPDEAFGLPDKIGGDKNAEAEEPDAPPTAEEEAASAAKVKRIEAFQRHAARVLFLRSPEERNIAIVLCLALEKARPKNERQWFTLQIMSTQVAQLSEDKQFLDDLRNIMRAVRAELQQ